MLFEKNLHSIVFFHISGGVKSVREQNYFYKNFLRLLNFSQVGQVIHDEILPILIAQSKLELYKGDFPSEAQNVSMAILCVCVKE